MRTAIRLGVAGALLVAVTAVQAASVNPDNGNYEYRPTGKGWGELVPVPPGIDVKNQAAKGARPQGSNGISYRGGPVMVDGVNVYYIWYGDWSGNTAPSILSDFAVGISNSDYWNINTTYYDGAKHYVKPIVTLSGQTSVAYPYGTSLSDSQIQQVVADAINGSKLTKDVNGVYFVLTSKDVTASSGFCTQYCGWHTHGSIAGSDIKFSFVGNPERCPSSCAAQTSTSPNGNIGADGMASIIAHELEEAATDPDLNAWYDNRGYENADKCAWTFGTTYTVANGSKANMNLPAANGRDFLIQQNWANAGGGYCGLKLK